MKKILHVDDEAALRELLGAYLGHQGYEVTSVATPTEALQAVGRTRPDLVICDLQLEEGDGLDVIDRMRAAVPGVPVILLTGVMLTPRVAQETVQKRDLVYIYKATPLNHLTDEIKRLLG
jgi:two-component system NtrC family response regulator